jgi:hypothetical protein
MTRVKTRIISDLFPIDWTFGYGLWGSYFLRLINPTTRQSLASTFPENSPLAVVQPLSFISRLLLLLLFKACEKLTPWF